MLSGRVLFFWLHWILVGVYRLSLVAVSRLPVGAASRFRVQILGTRASLVVALRLGCFVACGIFPDQGLNPCPLTWQMDSYPLYYQESPQQSFKTLSEQREWIDHSGSGGAESQKSRNTNKPWIARFLST